MHIQFVLLDTELFSLYHMYRSPQEENVPQIPYNDVNIMNAALYLALEHASRKPKFVRDSFCY